MSSERLIHRVLGRRVLVNAVIDGVLAAAAAPLARWVADPEGGLLHPLWFVAGGAITMLLGGLPFRLPQQYWRFSGVADLLGVVGGSAVAAALFALTLWASGFPLPTRTFPVVHALVLALLLGAPRVLYRLRRDRRSAGRASAMRGEPLPVLLAGAGEGADLFIRALGSSQGGTAYRVEGLLSMKAGQTGRRMHGHRIVGTIDQAGAVLGRLRAEGRLPAAVVVTDQDLSGAGLAELMAQADAEGVPVRRLPRLTALQGALRTATVELAPVAIEDLLNRPQVPLDRDGMARLVQGRRVLVTGAGGSIGSELARQVAALGPAELVLLDNGEYALWLIDVELGERFPGVARRAVVADVRDEGRIRSVAEETRPELVFHAAALKHVPMGEANPLEQLLTNALGTKNVLDAARAQGALAAVQISTDKAVNPTSVMGASKRLAEMYCQGLDKLAAGNGMRCVTVRFGNVLGSTGSVVPLFRRQLERGGPLTVTHPDMSRYFMTVREAVGLVLEASVVGTSLPRAETRVRQDHVKRGGIFVLDMGEPVKIVDLARQMIRLAGLSAEEVGIVFTGLRPGEKLYEELFHGREPPEPTGHPGLLMAVPRTADSAIVGRAIEEIAASCRAGKVGQAMAQLGRMVPEFGPYSSGEPAMAGERS